MFIFRSFSIAVILQIAFSFKLEVFRLCYDFNPKYYTVCKYFKEPISDKDFIVKVINPKFNLAFRIHEVSVGGIRQYTPKFVKIEGVENLNSNKTEYGPMVNGYGPNEWRDLVFDFNLKKNESNQYEKENHLEILAEFTSWTDPSIKQFLTLKLVLIYEYDDIIPLNIFTFDERDRILEYLLKEKVTIYSLDPHYINEIVDYIFAKDGPIKRASIAKKWKDNLNSINNIGQIYSSKNIKKDEL